MAPPVQCSRWQGCRLAALWAWASLACSFAQAPDALRATIPLVPEAAHVGPHSLYYEHGNDWTVGKCTSRAYQSPVSMDKLPRAPPTVFSEANYTPIGVGSVRLAARENVLSVGVAHLKLGGVTHNGEHYSLVRIDLHGPAEHLIRGIRHPLEIQLVHVSAKRRLLMVSLLVWCEHPPEPPNATTDYEIYVPPPTAEADFNPHLQHLLTLAPPDTDGAFVDLPLLTPLEMNKLVSNPKIEATQDFYLYVGSMTAPPCSEEVLWFVRRFTIAASDTQVRVLHHALLKLTNNHGSYRALMPWNGRPLRVARLTPYVPGETPKRQASDGSRLPWGSNPRTDKDFGVKVSVRNAKAAADAKAAEDARKLRQAEAEKKFWDSVKLRGSNISKVKEQAEMARRTREMVRDAAMNAARAAAESIATEAADLHREAARQAAEAAEMRRKR